MLTSLLMQAETNDFIAELKKSLADSTFVKLTLANYSGIDPHLQKITARLVDLKSGRRIAIQSRFDTREIVKNFEPGAGIAVIREHIENGFRSAHLFTTAGDLQLTVGKRSSRLIRGKASFKNKAATSHDRAKRYLVDPSAYYLKALGITAERNGSEQVRKGQRDKWVQIQKFIEVLDGLIRNSALSETAELRIVDMGSGKSYLTFALYDHLMSEKAAGRMSPVSVTGFEQRGELVSFCNDLAASCGFDGLRFVEGTIAEAEINDVDILIALHACDTATDDAIYKGIVAGAELIVAAPCCHHELRKQIRPPSLLAGILKHPVLLERTAEIITDGVRSMLLESQGYKTRIFEFVDTEHTPKNNLLVATKQDRSQNVETLKQQIAAIRNEFSISSQRLADLLRI